MAKKWTNRIMPGALHFVTGNVIDRKPIFKQVKFCLAFLKELQKLRTNRKCKVIVFVLMPDHLHLVLNPKGGDIRTAAGILKSLSAKRIVELAPENIFFKNGENQVWQESFKALPLWSNWMIRQKIDYIHANPVKANLCVTAADYRWTSFRSFYREESDPILAVDKDWWWEGDEERIIESVKQFEKEKRAALMEKIDKNRREHSG